MRSLRYTILGFVITILLTQCGGGTSGSGLKTYEGRVADAQGQGLANLQVIIESTGDSSITGGDGSFVIKSAAYGADLSMLLESESIQSSVMLPEISSESSLISLNITIDSETEVAQIQSIQLRAWFAGLCDHYFENRDIIRQANHVPEGTVCSLNVEVLGDGALLKDYPIELQYAACHESAIWKPIVSERTGNEHHQGYAEINFTYIDSPQYCRYRIRALGGIAQKQTVAYPIDTFSEQEYYDREK